MLAAGFWSTRTLFLDNALWARRALERFEMGEDSYRLMFALDSIFYRRPGRGFGVAFWGERSWTPGFPEEDAFGFGCVRRVGERAWVWFVRRV